MTSNEPHHRPRRAGAMTVAMRATPSTSERSALRVAIVRGGTILHDAVLAEQGAITVGRDESNRFVITGREVPKTLGLFELDAHGFLMRFTANMAGRVVLDGKPHTLATLTERAVRERELFVLRLPQRAQGKVSFGELSVLFELVAAPPRASQPQLPHGVKNGLSKGIDWMFTAFVVSSFIMHFGFVAYMESADHPVEDVRERIRSARLLIDDLPPPIDDEVPPPAPPRDDDEKTPASDQRAPKDAEIGRPKRDTDRSPRAEGQRADAQELAAEARKHAENLMLGAPGSTNGKAFDDMLRSGAVTTKADELFAAVQGSGIASRSPSGLLNTRTVDEGTRTHGLGSLASTSLSGSPIADARPLEESKIRGTVSAGEAEDEGGSGVLDAVEVTREIKKRLGAIRSCYEQALRRDAGLAGKLTVTFTIEQSGTVSRVALREDSMRDAVLSMCVTRTISLVRLRVAPTSGSVDFSYPFVFRGEH